MASIFGKFGNQENRNSQQVPPRILKGAAGITIGCIFLLMLVWNCVYKINPGYAGVVYNIDGGVEETVLPQGWNLLLPWKHVTEYPVSTETVYYTNDELVRSKAEDSGKRIPDPGILINSKDGKRVSANLTYSYHMDPTKLPSLYTKFKGQSIRQIEGDFIKSQILMKVADVTTQYSQMEISGDKLPEINNKILEAVRKDFEPIGIILESLSIAGVEPDEQTKAAIQRVIEAQNQTEQAKAEREKAAIDADKARIQAEGAAAARLVEAESIAKANEMVRQSLTPEIVQKQWIEKWDGKLPQVQSGNGGVLVNVPNN